jgi:hypothetical protein
MWSLHNQYFFVAKWCIFGKNKTYIGKWKKIVEEKKK